MMKFLSKEAKRTEHPCRARNCWPSWSVRWGRPRAQGGGRPDLLAVRPSVQHQGRHPQHAHRGGRASPRLRHPGRPGVRPNRRGEGRVDLTAQDKTPGTPRPFAAPGGWLVSPVAVRRRIETPSGRSTRVATTCDPAGGTADPRFSAKNVDELAVTSPGPPSTSAPSTMSGWQA